MEHLEFFTLSGTEKKIPCEIICPYLKYLRSGMLYERTFSSQFYFLDGTLIHALQNILRRVYSHGACKNLEITPMSIKRKLDNYTTE